MVEPGSTLRTDGWGGYNLLTQHGYIHEPASHKNAESGDATPAAQLVASLLKRWLLGTHQGAVSHEHPPYYLDEFTPAFAGAGSSASIAEPPAQEASFSIGSFSRLYKPNP